MFKSLRFRFVALPAVALAVALYVISSNIGTAYRTVEVMEDTLTRARLTVSISVLVHEMQMERGKAGSFVGSSGRVQATELATQQRVTDEAFANLQQFLATIDVATIGPELNDALVEAVDALDRIDGHRRKLSRLSMSRDDAT